VPAGQPGFTWRLDQTQLCWRNPSHPSIGFYILKRPRAYAPSAKRVYDGRRVGVEARAASAAASITRVATEATSTGRSVSTSTTGPSVRSGNFFAREEGSPSRHRVALLVSMPRVPNPASEPFIGHFGIAAAKDFYYRPRQRGQQLVDRLRVPEVVEDGPSRSCAMRTIAASAARLNVLDQAKPPYPTASKSRSLIASFEINGTPRACDSGSARLVFPDAGRPLTTTKRGLEDTSISDRPGRGDRRRAHLCDRAALDA
jgi:hypothetical protein